ncbi:MAG: thioredoxin family protein, partial [Candidatus Bipolaricaulota bacterium]
GYGMLLKQDQQAQSIGAVLCTSCVGIEQTPRQDPELSSEARTRIAAISQEVELLFFTAIWCQACPYAKAMLQQVVETNPLISHRLIDVDEDRDAAKHYGIVRSGRTIVPAILRVDTGEVVFGIEDLEERLITLLEKSS